MGRPKGSTTRKPAAVLEDVIMGLDIGSTSTRVCLFSPSSDKEIGVDSGHIGDYSRFEPGDFSTSCYPFDQGTTYIGNVIDRERIATSLKPVFLLLCGLDREELEDLVSEYPHAQELLRGMDPQSKNHKTFKRKLNTAVQYFFRFLKTQTLETCRAHAVRITTVGISVPGQWPSLVEDYMTEKFLEHFCGRGNVHLRVERDKIFFHGETQALAHFFFRNHADEPRVANAKNGVFLLADFGGQNLNISTYQIGPGLAGRMTFFEIGYSRGIAGGSESHDYLVGEHCASIVAQDGRHLGQSDKQALINDFHIKKRELDDRHNVIQRERATHGNKIILRGDKGTVVTLSPREVRRAFKEAMEGPLAVLTEELDKALRLTGRRRLQIIVAGGSARSLALQDKVTAVCRRRKMKSPIFVEKIRRGVRDRSFNIAKGAAYATANDILPEDFIKRGAGIGIQMKEYGEAVWNDAAEFLCKLENQVTRTIELNDGDELKLICNPLLGNEPTETISYNDAYDIYELGAFREGKAKLNALFQRARGVPSLFLEMKWFPKGASGDYTGKTFPGHIRLPLMFHRSSSCVLVEMDSVNDELPVEAFLEDHPDQPEIIDTGVSDQLAGQGVGSATLGQSGHVGDQDILVQLEPNLSSDFAVQHAEQGIGSATQAPNEHMRGSAVTFQEPAPGDSTYIDFTDTGTHSGHQRPVHTPLTSRVQADISVANALMDNSTAQMHNISRYTPGPAVFSDRQVVNPGAACHTGDARPPRASPAATGAPTGHIAPLANMDLNSMDMDPTPVEANRWVSCARQGSKSLTPGDGDENPRTYSESQRERSPEPAKTPRRPRAHRGVYRSFNYFHWDTTDEEISA